MPRPPRTARVARSTRSGHPVPSTATRNRDRESGSPSAVMPASAPSVPSGGRTSGWSRSWESSTPVLRRRSAPGTRGCPRRWWAAGRARRAALKPAAGVHAGSRSCAVWTLSRAERVCISTAAARSSDERLASPQTSQASATDSSVSRTRSRTRWSILLAAYGELGGDADQYRTVRLTRLADDLSRENRVVVRQLGKEAGNRRRRGGVGRDDGLDPARPGGRPNFDPGNPDSRRSGSPHGVQGGTDRGSIEHSREQEGSRLSGRGPARAPANQPW